MILWGKGFGRMAIQPRNVDTPEELLGALGHKVVHRQLEKASFEWFWSRLPSKEFNQGHEAPTSPEGVAFEALMQLEKEAGIPKV